MPSDIVAVCSKPPVTRRFSRYPLAANDDTLTMAEPAGIFCTSDSVSGDYTYLRSFRPLGHESRDIGQFIDDDGSAYLIFESRPTKGFFIAALSGDYLSVDRQVALVERGARLLRESSR